MKFSSAGLIQKRFELEISLATVSRECSRFNRIQEQNVSEMFLSRKCPKIRCYAWCYQWLGNKIPIELPLQVILEWFGQEKSGKDRTVKSELLLKKLKVGKHNNKK